jgi:CHAT domain-containing protein
LFHFSGHGEAEPGSDLTARILLTGRVENNSYVPDYLRSNAVAQNARLKSSNGNRALAVLNACQVGRANWQLTSIGGFAEAFLRAGAGIFLGTLWSVGDGPARTFTEAFYEKLRVGGTVAEASIDAREKARKKAIPAGDATWLAYVVYGHPYARVKFQ